MKMFRALSIFLLTAFSSVAIAGGIDKAVSDITNIDQLSGPKVTKSIEEGVFGTAQLMIFVVAIIAFLWVSYSAVAKFRECQSGRADWSELLVLGVAAAALLVFVGLTISTATGFLVGP